MFLDTYKNTVIKNLSLHQTNTYNINMLGARDRVSINSSFTTFKSDKNLKFTKLYYLLFMVGGQKPILKRVRFMYLNKKILKRFNIVSTLGKFNKTNFLLYLSNFYFYFYHIYYEKGLKYNSRGNDYDLYLDNIQFFIKSYYKQAQKTQLKVTLTLSNAKHTDVFRQLTNTFFLKVKKR